MSATNETPIDQLSLRALQDRIAVTDVLYRYSSAIDSFDHERVRSVLADDVHAQYGNLDPVSGGDALAQWISGATAAIAWQHHLLSVYHVDVDGDQASALSYLTSHQVFDGSPTWRRSWSRGITTSCAARQKDGSSATGWRSSCGGSREPPTRSGCRSSVAAGQRSGRGAEPPPHERRPRRVSPVGGGHEGFS
jgi:hypothetical protein